MKDSYDVDSLCLCASNVRDEVSVNHPEADVIIDQIGTPVANPR